MPGDPVAAPPPLARFTRIVVVLLVVDALVLGAVGLYARRPSFVAVAALSLAAAWVAQRMVRGYYRRLAEIEATRRELRDEVRAMAGDLRQRPPGGGPSAGTR
ncbi:MAG TPA: hypothetical protein VF862_04355 [Gemmatimonadales bacterium]